MKAILMSIRPEWVCKILNKEKTLEIRKKFPKDYVGWVYIYCTKNSPRLLQMDEIENNIYAKLERDCDNEDLENSCDILNGKVVARFWCGKWCGNVEEIEAKLTALGYAPYTKTLSMPDLLKNSCLTIKDLDNYLRGNKGYAIRITKLEIFDKPREIKEFSAYCKKSGMECLHCKHYWTDDSAGYSIPKCSGKPLTRAPSTYCYVEV